MTQKHWMIIAVVGFLLFITVGIFSQAIGFNNKMISLQERKKAEIETTKVEYGQCIIKIMETNSVAKSYSKDVMALADKAGADLANFQKQMVSLVSTQIIPNLSPELKQTVQREIISCRNAYTGRVDLSLKPMYVTYNMMQRQFPNSIYNSLLYHWQTEDLIMPKAEEGEEIFKTGTIKPLNLE